MNPLVETLIKNGLGLLASAIKSKGQEFVEAKLGVSLDHKSPEDLLVLQAHNENQILTWLELETQLTQRWTSDNSSDSQLTKHVRPATLIVLLATYFLLALLSAFDINVQSAYVELLGQWGMLVMTAYFGGRTVEKVMALKNQKGDQNETIN